LRAIGVLVFVDEEVAIAALVALADVSGDLEEAGSFEEQVVEDLLARANVIEQASTFREIMNFGA